MAQTVQITTPIPSLDEFGDRLNISRSRRETLRAIVTRHSVKENPGARGRVGPDAAKASKKRAKG